MASVGVGTSGTLVHAAPRYATAEECGAWQNASLPKSAQKGQPMSVVASADGRAWIFGAANEKRPKPLAVHWDGTAWTDVPLPWSDGLTGLVGGDMTGPALAWAVGFRRAPTLPQPISARWNGTAWVAIKVPNPGGASSLTDAAIEPGGRVWAVGASIRLGRSRPLAYVWTPSHWTRVDPLIGSREGGLTSVARSSSGQIWATGWKQVHGLPRPWLLHRVSGTWVEIPTAPLDRGMAVLTHVEFAGETEAWITGFLVTSSGRYQPILEHWDGSTWSLVDLPWSEGISAVLSAVSVDGGGVLTVAGSYVATDARRALGFVAQLSEETWSVQDLPRGATSQSDLVSTASTATGALVVGTGSGKAKVLQRCLNGPTEIPAATGGQETSNSSGRDNLDADKDTGADAGADAEDDPLMPGVVEPRSSAPALPRAVPLAGFQFRDVATAAGLAETEVTYEGVAADFNGDGWTDVYIGHHNVKPARLALGGPDGFQPAMNPPFPRTDAHGCATADVDADVALDLFCAVGAVRGTSIKSNELVLHPAVDGQPAAAAFGVVDPYGRGRQATFLHLPGDALPDLFLTNATNRVDGLPTLNKLFRNVDGNHFEEVAGSGLDASISGLCAMAADIDGDLDDDLLVCAESVPSGSVGLRIFRQDAGTFTDATVALGISPMVDQDALAVDLNGDGRLDLVQLSRRVVRVSLWNTTTNQFTRAFEAPISNGRAVAAGDVNGDGRQDLYIVDGGRPNRPDLLLVNAGDGRSYTSVTIPTTTRGYGDDVLPIDYDHNGLADFVVLNGCCSVGSEGPLQLIASFPSP